MEGHGARDDKIQRFFDNMSINVSIPKPWPHYYQEK